MHLGTGLTTAEVAVEDAPAAESDDEREAAARDAGAAEAAAALALLSPADRARLEQQQQQAAGASSSSAAGFAVIECGPVPGAGVQLLVSETPEGLLDLSDAFVFDPDAGGGAGCYARPVGAGGGEGAAAGSSSSGGYPGDLPRGPRRYRGFPWRETKPGDVLKGRDSEVTLRRMYFVPCGGGLLGGGGGQGAKAKRGAEGRAAASSSEDAADDTNLDLTELYAFDAAERSLKRVPVLVRPPPGRCASPCSASAATAPPCSRRPRACRRPRPWRRGTTGRGRARASRGRRAC